MKRHPAPLAAVLTAPSTWRDHERAAWPAFASLVLVPYLAARTSAARDRAFLITNTLDAYARVLLGCDAAVFLSLHAEGDEAYRQRIRATTAELLSNVAHGLNCADPGQGSIMVAVCAVLFDRDPWGLAATFHDDAQEPTLPELARTLQRFVRHALRRLDKHPPRGSKRSPPRSSPVRASTQDAS